MPDETYAEFLQRRMAQQSAAPEHSLGGAFTSGLTLGYAGEDPQTIPELLAYGAGSIPSYVAAEYATGGGATALLGARAAAALKAFSAARPLISSALRQGAIFGTLGALQKPHEGESRLGQGLEQGAVGAAFPFAGAALRPVWEGIAPYAMPSSYVAAKLLPGQARGPVSEIVKRLITGERRISQYETSSLDTLKKLTRGVRGDELKQLLESLQGKSAEEAQAMLPPELFPRFQGIRELLNQEWAGQQSALRSAAWEKLAEKGEVPNLRKLYERYPDEPPIEGYYPHGASANYFVLRKQPDGTFGLTPGSRDVARTYSEARAIQQAHMEAGVPEADIQIRPRSGYGGAAQKLQVSRPAFFSLTGKLAKLEGLTPEEFLAELGEELPFRMKGAPWQPPKGKFAGFRQHREDILGAPEASLSDLTSYLGQSARFRGLTPELAYAGRQKEAVLKALGGENTRWGKWFTDYLGRVTGKPSAFESHINELLMGLAQRGNPLAAHFAGDPFAVRRLAGAVRGLTGVLKLGLSPAAALWNLAQTSNTAAVTGPKTAVRAIWEVLQHGEKWRSIMQEAGVQFESAELGKLTLGELKTPLEPIYKPAMWMFSKSERFNQGVAAVAGYLEAKERGLPRSGAIEHAKDVLLRTQFHYGQADIPQVMAGPLGKILFQFKPFVANQLAFMAGLSKKEAARYFPMMAALAGTGAIPFKEELDLAAKMISGEQPISEIELEHPRLSSGIPGLLGVSTQQSLGVTQGALPTGQRWERALGPTIGSVLEAVQRLGKGEPADRAIASQAVAMRRGIRAIETMTTGGVRSPETGELIYNAPGEGPSIPAWQHQPRDVAEAKRLLQERLPRQLRYTPLVARGRAYGRYKAAEAEKAASPGKAMLAFMLMSGLTPTALRAQLLAGNLTADDIARVLAARRAGETPQEILDSMRELR